MPKWAVSPRLPRRRGNDSASLGVVNFAHLVENFAHRKVVGTEFHFQRCIGMTRLAGPLLACALALGGGHANAQAGATPPTESKRLLRRIHLQRTTFVGHSRRQRRRTPFRSNFSPA